MKVLLDSCVSGHAAGVIRQAGHDVTWAGDWPADPGDENILRVAVAESRDGHDRQRLWRTGDCTQYCACRVDPNRRVSGKRTGVGGCAAYGDIRSGTYCRRCFDGRTVASQTTTRLIGIRPPGGSLTKHCNGPAGRNGPCDSNAARCPAGR